LEGARVTATVRKLEKRGRAEAQRDVPRIGLGMLLRDANAAFNRVLREELAQHGITFSQYQHLRQLWHADGLAQVELSRRIGIETASSTAVIDQLERLGLIRRKRDLGDRRRIIVTLTPAGRALEKPLDDCAIAVNLRARDGLSKAEVAGLFDAVGKIVRNLRHPRGL
jgi:DNA-binding MarR family transcriptional regulator